MDEKIYCVYFLEMCFLNVCWLYILSWNFIMCNLFLLNFWIRLMLLKICKKEMGYDLFIIFILYKYLYKLCILSFMIKYNFIVIFMFIDNLF